MIKAAMKRYGAYKDSGVEWIEEFPTEWGVKRLKEILRGVVYGTSEKTEEIGNYEVLGMGDIYEGKITFPKKKFINNVPEDLLLKKEDLLFNRTNSIALVGKVGWIDEILVDVTFASYLIRLRVMRNQCSRYFWYLLNSEYFICYSRSNAIQTANQANLSSSKLKQFKIPAIDYKLQKNIADYLDTKTAQIDCKIDLLTQKATQYGKLKQSLINETVTHGLDKSVAIKDSGVDWLGDVPEHWDMMRLKELATIQNSNVDKKSHENEISVRLCNYVDVYRNEFIDSSLDFMKATAAESEIKRFTIKKSDVFITKDSETCDDIAIPALATETLEGVLCGYHLAQFRTQEKMLSGSYLFRLFQSKSYGFRFVISAKGITRVGLGQSAIADSLTPIPPLPEQKTIANYLDSKTAHIDRIVETINTQIDKLKELSKTLINDVVIGKIKVVEG